MNPLLIIGGALAYFGLTAKETPTDTGDGYNADTGEWNMDGAPVSYSDYRYVQYGLYATNYYIPDFSAAQINSCVDQLGIEQLKFYLMSIVNGAAGVLPGENALAIVKNFGYSITGTYPPAPPTGIPTVIITADLVIDYIIKMGCTGNELTAEDLTATVNYALGEQIQPYMFDYALPGVQGWFAEFFQSQNWISATGKLSCMYVQKDVDDRGDTAGSSSTGSGNGAFNAGGGGQIHLGVITYDSEDSGDFDSEGAANYANAASDLIDSYSGSSEDPNYLLDTATGTLDLAADILTLDIAAIVEDAVNLYKTISAWIKNEPQELGQLKEWLLSIGMDEDQAGEITDMVIETEGAQDFLGAATQIYNYLKIYPVENFAPIYMS